MYICCTQDSVRYNVHVLFRTHVISFTEWKSTYYIGTFLPVLHVQPIMLHFPDSDDEVLKYYYYTVHSVLLLLESNKGLLPYKSVRR